MQVSNLKRYVVVFVFIVSALAVSILLYNMLVFRVTRTEPDPNNFPTIAPYIDIYFSKPIDKLESYTLNEEVAGTISIHEKRIRFTPSSLFSDNTEYTLELKDVRSKSGDRLDYSYTFTAVYMNYSDVPKEIQDASVKKSSSGQIDDPFFNNYFPMQTEDFQVEHPHDDTETDSKKVLYVTFLKEVYNYDTNTRTSLTNEEADRAYEKLMKFIESKGGTPKDYDIYFSNEYLNKKYPQEHSKP